MYPLGSANSFQGCMTMPKSPVISPPVRKVIQRGKALAKSLAGDTTLAAMFTDSVAITTVNMDIATIQGCWNLPTSTTGSHMDWPKIIGLADVIMTPMAANTVMVVGNATTWPTICSRWLRPNRVKSCILSDSVAQ